MAAAGYGFAWLWLRLAVAGRGWLRCSADYVAIQGVQHMRDKAQLVRQQSARAPLFLWYDAELMTSATLMNFDCLHLLVGLWH